MPMMYRKPYDDSSDEYDTLEGRGYIERLEKELFDERKKYSEAQREIQVLSSKYVIKENDFKNETKRIMKESASQISTLEILLAAEREKKPKRSPSPTKTKRNIMENPEDQKIVLQDKNATLQSEVNRLSIQTEKDGITIRSLTDEVSTVLTLLQRSKRLNHEQEETNRILTVKNHELELENKWLKEHNENYETALRSLQQERYHHLICKQCGFDPSVHPTAEGRKITRADLSSVGNQESLLQNTSLKSKLEETSKMIHSGNECTDSTSSEDTGSGTWKNAKSGNTEHRPTSSNLNEEVSRAPEKEESVHAPQPHDRDGGDSVSVGASIQQENNCQISETNKVQDAKHE